MNAIVINAKAKSRKYIKHGVVFEYVSLPS